MATNNTGNTVLVNTVGGGINRNTPCGGCTSDRNLVLNLSSANGAQGQTVCLDLRVTDFTNIDRLQFTLNYNATNLTFSQVNNFGLPGLGLSNFTVGPAGQIVFNWQSSNGQTLANDSRLFSLCFTIQQVRETPVAFMSTPTAIQARNGCGANVGVVHNNGTINVGAPMGDELTLILDCPSGTIGQQVCVPIRAFNFTNILSFQFSIAFDATRLAYVGQGTMPGLSSIFANSNAPGQLRLSWNSSTGNGQTLAAGAQLTSFCFTILSNEPASVAFSSLPVPTEFINGNVQIVSADLRNCAINGTAAPTITNASITPPTCSESTNGRIEVTVTGPGPFNYIWTPNPSGATGPIISGLAPGNYTVQITSGSGGQSTTGTYTVPSVPAFLCPSLMLME
ncbi:MAG: hypothetical protein HC821_02175 [Lewinella sp.]|nr:hypothetical protein [Lewinella sp.]